MKTRLKSDLIIYNFRNLINGKRYIGRTIQGRGRYNEHMCSFRLGDRSKALYVAFEKYGLENFVYEVLCSVLDASYLDELEREFIIEYDSYRKGYNMTPGGDTPELTPERTAKIAATLTGRKRTYRDPATEVAWPKKAWETRRRNLAEDPNCYKDMRTVARRGAKSSQAQRVLVRFPDGTKHIIVGLHAFMRQHGLGGYFLSTIKYKKRYNKGYKLLAKLKPAARFND